MYRVIYAFSKGRAQLADWIEDHTAPVAKALAQLYLFPDTPYVNHWRTEVYSNFHTMKVLSTTKKLPSAKFIYDNSWKIGQQFAEQHLNWAIKHESNLKPRENWSVEEYSKRCVQYFSWLSVELSNYVSVENIEVHKTLVLIGL